MDTFNLEHTVCVKPKVYLVIKKHLKVAVQKLKIDFFYVYILNQNDQQVNFQKSFHNDLHSKYWSSQQVKMFKSFIFRKTSEFLSHYEMIMSLGNLLINLPLSKMSVDLLILNASHKMKTRLIIN